MNGLLGALLLCLQLVYTVKPQCLTPNDRTFVSVQNGMNTLYSGEQQFSFEVFKRLNSVEKTGNVFFSPYSIHSALLLAYFGAQNRTETELSRALGLTGVDKVNIMRAYKAVKKMFDMRNKINPSKNYKFNVANKLYFDRNENVRNCMHNLFHEEITKVNFSTNVEMARLQINSWVKQKTNKMINNFIPQGYINPSTTMALVNAAYFKGQWESQFKPERTKDALFYGTTSELTMVKMMEQKGTFKYGVAETLGAYILEMPYVGNDMSMFILLPPYGEEALQKTIYSLSVDNLKEAMRHMYRTQVRVSLPKFKVEQTYELPQILQDMGISDLFNPALADLSAFTGTRPNYIGKIRHKAVIEVNEEGSEAAAATVLVGFRTARPLEPEEFECNHPFIYYIFDKFSNTILFIGIYRNPKLLS